jgi:hypothetical protein
MKKGNDGQPILKHPNNFLQHDITSEGTFGIWCVKLKYD